MKPQPIHALAAAALIAAAVLAEIPASREATASAATSDPSVPSASTVFKNGDAREGNVVDLTY